MGYLVSAAATLQDFIELYDIEYVHAPSTILYVSSRSYHTWTTASRKIYQNN